VAGDLALYDFGENAIFHQLTNLLAM
jgi:hypothetical protein